MITRSGELVPPLAIEYPAIDAVMPAGGIIWWRNSAAKPHAAENPKFGEKPQVSRGWKDLETQYPNTAIFRVIYLTWSGLFIYSCNTPP